MVNNLFRSTIALTIAIYTLGHTIETVSGNDLCTMDGMRRHAADACEILMRHIRSADGEQSDLPYDIVDLKDLNTSESELPHSNQNHHHHHRSHHDKTAVYLKKQEFPNDGYLKVDEHLSKYLVRTNLDAYAYKTDGNSVDNNDDSVVYSFVEYGDSQPHQHHHHHHSHKHRARQHPRFRRQQDETNVKYCCQYPESAICKINMC